MGRIIKVVTYDPEWPVIFSEEAARLKAGLGLNLFDLHHIGSTAIIGLAAKPIIDILCVVQSLKKLDRYDDIMRDLGYQPKGENGIEGRRYYQKLDGEVHLVHVHAFEDGHPDIERHLNFRDYLRAHPVDARAYENLKLRLAARFSLEPKRYTDEKSDFICSIDKRAAEWRAKTEESGDGA